MLLGFRLYNMLNIFLSFVYKVLEHNFGRPVFQYKLQGNSFSKCYTKNNKIQLISNLVLFSKPSAKKRARALNFNAVKVWW